MLGLFKQSGSIAPNTRLFDQDTFYKAFIRDLGYSRTEVIIESPFVTNTRVGALLPTLQKLTKRGTKVTINTRHPSEHGTPFDAQAWEAIRSMQAVGVEVLFTGGHHRKLAVLDRRILWEGSLNILSQNDSCEIMRRTDSEAMAQQMIRFVKLDKFLR